MCVYFFSAYIPAFWNNSEKTKNNSSLVTIHIADKTETNIKHTKKTSILVDLMFIRAGMIWPVNKILKKANAMSLTAFWESRKYSTTFIEASNNPVNTKGPAKFSLLKKIAENAIGETSLDNQ